jgi:hypothetical protein
MKKLQPLSPEVQELLAASRGVMPLAPSVETRAIARAAALAESPEPVTLRPAPRPGWAFAAAAGLVLALGAAAYASHIWFDRPAAPSARVTAPAATASRPLPADTVVPENDTPKPIAPPVRHSRTTSGVGAARPTNAELQLLLSARRDVTQGDFAGALAVIGEHTRRFRNGILVEEREALRVKSLAGLGRHADAQRAAARFHQRFPHSVLLSTFERMTEPDR